MGLCSDFLSIGCLCNRFLQAIVRRCCHEFDETGQDGILSAWLPRALRTMSKQDMLRLIDLICRLNPGWKDNVAFARELDGKYRSST